MVSIPGEFEPQTLLYSTPLQAIWTIVVNNYEKVQFSNEKFSWLLSCE